MSFDLPYPQSRTRPVSRRKNSSTVSVILGCLACLVVFRLIVDGVELYNTTMLDSGIHKKLTSLIGGGGGSGGRRSREVIDPMLHADELNPIRKIQTNVSWSIDGHCVNLSSVPTEIVRKTYPIKLMEVN